MFLLPLSVLGSSALLPSDPNASASARSLFASLAALSGAPKLKMAFGAQRTNQEGVHWSAMDGSGNRSDILTNTGEWPSMFGFNFGSLTNGFSDVAANAASLPNVVAAAKRAGELGGIIAAHFPTNNPIKCSHKPEYKDCEKDPTGEPMKNLLPKGQGNESNGKGNKQWNAWLDAAAAAAHAVAPSPLLFRPFHENYLNNWWGSPYCTPSEFIAGWRYTVDYLRNTKNVHNMLFVYAPDQPVRSISSPLGYAERWPGDDYVDVCAFDHYDHPSTPHHCADSNFTNEFLADIHMVVNFAVAHGKIPAVGEFGMKGGVNSMLDAECVTVSSMISRGAAEFCFVLSFSPHTYSMLCSTNSRLFLSLSLSLSLSLFLIISWWTRCLLEPLATDTLAPRLAYAMTWCNNEDNEFVPMKGNLTFASFEEFAKSDNVVLGTKWNN